MYSPFYKPLFQYLNNLQLLLALLVYTLRNRSGSHFGQFLVQGGQLTFHFLVSFMYVRIFFSKTNFLLLDLAEFFQEFLVDFFHFFSFLLIARGLQIAHVFFLSIFIVRNKAAEELLFPVRRKGLEMELVQKFRHFCLHRIPQIGKFFALFFYFSVTLGNLLHRMFYRIEIRYNLFSQRIQISHIRDLAHPLQNFCFLCF